MSICHQGLGSGHSFLSGSGGTSRSLHLGPRVYIKYSQGLVGLPQFPKRAGSYTSMLLFLKEVQKYRSSSFSNPRELLQLCLRISSHILQSFQETRQTRSRVIDILSNYIMRAEFIEHIQYYSLPLQGGHYFLLDRIIQEITADGPGITGHRVCQRVIGT